MATRARGGLRIGLGLSLVILAGLLWLDGEADLAAQLMLVVLFPYVLLVWPFQCRERTRAGTACALHRWGLLFGCGYHRWRRVRRGLSILTGGRYQSDPRPLGDRPARSTEGQQMPGLPRQPEAPDGRMRRRMYQGVMLVATVAGAVAGIVQVLR